MSSLLLVPLYVGLVPLILVSGIVLAVKRRHLLGARASNQLAAGAGLLLVGHLWNMLRPLVTREIINDDGRLSGWVSELIAALTLLQIGLQAAGIGLIIAAAVSPRLHTLQIDQDANHEATNTAARTPADASRPATLPRTWMIVTGIAAILILAAIAAWIIRSPGTSQTPPWRLTEDQQAAQCLEHYEELNLPVKAKPVERMLLRKDGGWLRLYVSQPDNWITACHGGPDGLTGNFGTIMQPGPPDKLRFFGGYDSVLKAHLLLGHMPTGGTFIEARLANGQTVKGEHDGDIFVIWAPGGLPVEGAQVTVSTQDRVVIAAAAAPADGDPE